MTELADERAHFEDSVLITQEDLYAFYYAFEERMTPVERSIVDRTLERMDGAGQMLIQSEASRRQREAVVRILRKYCLRRASHA